MESRDGPIALPPQLHVGVVVRDMEKTIHFLSSTFGIGPWDIRERRYAAEQVEVGKGPFAYKVAFATLGPIQLELLEVLEGSTIHSEFLNTKGEGVHHLGFRVPDVQQTVSALQQRGVGVLQSAFRPDGRYAYVDGTKFGGITFEFVQRITK